MLQTTKPFTLIPVAILPLMDTVPGRFRLAPLSYVRVSEDALPDALAFFKTEAPLTLVHFAVGPCINAFSVRFTINELTFISVSV